MERDPIMFVEMAELAAVSEPWLREAREAFNKGEAVPCIKAIRAGKAIGLWEAKQVYDAWRNGSWMCDDYRVTNEMIDILVTLRG